MNKKNRLITLCASLLAIALVVYLIGGRHVADQSASSIQIAANLPLSGDLAFYGEAFRDGLLLANEEHADAQTQNAIKFDWGDNQFSPKEAVSVLQKQLLRHPTIYTSALKPEVMAVTSQVSQAGIPHFEWILDVDTNTGGSTNNLRCWVSFKLEAEVFLKYSLSHHFKRLAIVYLSLPSSEIEYGKIIIPELTKNGYQILREPFTDSAQPADFQAIAAKVAAFQPDEVMINGFIPQMVSIVRDLRPFGIVRDGKVLASLDMLDASNALTPQESEGIVVAAPVFLLNPSPEQQKWSERFQKRFGHAPSYHSAFAYDMGLIILDAIRRIHIPASNEQWVSAFRSTKTQGVTGTLEFDSDGSLITTLVAAKYHHGILSTIE